MNAQVLVFTVLLLFCRIGGCLMVAPGFSATQIPSQIRLFVAVGATLALAPLLIGQAKIGALEPIGMCRLIASELVAGVAFGLLARLFFAALETIAFAAATLLAISNPFGVEMERGQATPPLATLITLGATTLIFVTDVHWQIVIALVDSYHAIPFGSAFQPRRTLAEVGDVLGQSFFVATRVASPFFLYSVIVNFAMALVNRVTPQIAIFFIAPPFVIAGGLALLYFTIRAQVQGFVAAFSAWLNVM
jgi:flagellar biosynthetic protein FliR